MNTAVKPIYRALTGTVAGTVVVLLGLSATAPAQDKIPLTVGLISLASRDNAGDSSALAGIEIPRSGQSFTGAGPHFASLLRAVAKEKAVKQNPVGDGAEAWVWRGENFREDRVAFTQAALGTALEKAGYTVNEIPYTALREVNLYDHFDKFGADAGKLPLVPEGMPDYFLATNPSKGRAFLGAWVKNEEALALGLLPVQSQAAPKAGTLPAAPAGAVLVPDYNDTMKGVAPLPAPRFPALARKPRVVRGWIRDGAGRPVANASVSAYSSVGGGVRTTHRARSNAQGLYEILLPTGIAELADAKATVVYNGQSFELPLRPTGGEFKQFNGQDGQVEHLVLKTAGEYGGTLRMQDNLTSGIIELTLTPVGPQLDGSAGRTFVYRIPAEKSSETYLNGMPIGRYKLTARLLDGDEVLPLRTRPTFGSDDVTKPRESLDVNFEPGYTFSPANPGKSNSGIARFEVTLQP